MKLLNDEIKRTLPPIRGQEHVADPVAHVKFFTPWAGFTWFVTEGEEGGEGDYLFFGRSATSGSPTSNRSAGRAG
jgi:hypothetical protein